MKAELKRKIDPLVRGGSFSEAVQMLKDELAKSADSLDASFLAQDIARLLHESGDETKALHYAFLAAEHFIQEGQIFNAIFVAHELNAWSGGEEKYDQLRHLIADSVSTGRRLSHSDEEGMPLPTPFQEMTASVDVEAGPSGEIQRGQLLNLAPRRISLFSSLRAPELSALVSTVVPRKYSAGEAVYETGDLSPSFYVLVRGAASLKAEGNFERAVVMGDFVGDMAFLAGIKRNATLRAEEEAEFLEFKGKEFVELFRKFPNFQEKVWRFYEKRMFSNVVSNTELFKGLSEEELTLVHEYFTAVNVPEGRVLMREGSPVHRLSFVAQGECEILEPKERKATIRMGSFFGSEEFLRQQLSSYRLVAKTQSYILECQREVFNKLCRSIPRLVLNVQRLEEDPTLPPTAGRLID